MDLRLDETIAAVASAPGGAARAIVRVSGVKMRDVVAQCLELTDGRDTAAALAALRRATVLVGTIRLAGFCQPLPCDAYIWPTARSYTRESLAELHLPGSPPLAAAVVEAVCAAGARVARPGEFTMRAFLAGRLDLTQAEAVLGVIDATERSAANVALTQLAGGLSGPLRALRDDLVELLALLEAGLDFAEEDIEFVSRDEVCRRLEHAARAVAELQRVLRWRWRSDALVRVVLHGRPNVGKSSLFNALIGDVDVAITSEEAGTTRDYLTATLRLDDIACQIVDTAGRGETTVGETEVAGVAGDDAINRAADAKSAAQAGTADVELFCLDASRHPDAWEREQLRAAPASPRVVVLTKCDLSPASDYTELLAGTDTWVATSSTSGLGLDRLRAEVRRRVVVDATEAAGVVGSTAARCGESLRLACESLERAAALAAEGGEELVAAEIRAGLDALGEVVGAVYTDDVLERIFSRFCIGK